MPGRFTQCVSDHVGQRRSSGRSRLGFDAADNAYVVMPFARVVTASEASGPI